MRRKTSANVDIASGDFYCTIARDALRVASRDLRMSMTAIRREIAQGRLRDHFRFEDELTRLTPHAAEYIGQPNCDASTQSPRRVRNIRSSCVPGFIYIVKGDESPYKIGRAVKIQRRVWEINLTLPFEASLIHAIAVDNMVEVERFLHRKFAPVRVRGEWFALTDSDVEWLRSFSELSIGDCLLQEGG